MSVRCKILFLHWLLTFSLVFWLMMDVVAATCLKTIMQLGPWNNVQLPFLEYE